MVRLRLRRVGGNNQPTFRVVAADKESPRNGRFIEIVGFYNPRTQPATIQLKEDRIYEWISKGAQPSDSAMAVFKTAGLLERYERFKTGEKVDALLQEAEAAAKSRNTSRLTRHAAPVKSKKPRKKEGEAPKPAGAAPAQAPAESAPVAEETAPAPEAGQEAAAPQEPSAPVAEETPAAE
jgi:small subunit ribosomal protein S16